MFNTRNLDSNITGFADTVFDLLNDEEKERLSSKIHDWRKTRARKDAALIGLTLEEEALLWNNGERPKTIDTIMKLRDRMHISILVAKEVVDAYLERRHEEQKKLLKK